jgi:hypothetical protein
MANLKDVTDPVLSITDKDGNVLATKSTGPQVIAAAQKVLKPIVAENVFAVKGPKGNQRWQIYLEQQVKVVAPKK